jgi:hypothetical protein
VVDHEAKILESTKEEKEEKQYANAVSAGGAVSTVDLKQEKPHHFPTAMPMRT